MKRIFYFLIILFIVSCADEQKQLSVIGTRNGDLITVKPDEVKDTVDLNLSDFVEDIEIVRLETTKGSLVKPAPVILSDNYILTGMSDMKLFDRKTGKYIGNVGYRGRGPGEYRSAIYSAQIDEKAGSIYMLSYLNQTDRLELLVYDLNGKWRGKNIPLASFPPKGVFHVDSEHHRLRIATSPFEGECEYVAWEQDLEGNMINGVKTKHLAVYPDYSNEISQSRNTQNFDFSLFDIRKAKDTLYHYNGGDQLSPVFYVDCGSKKAFRFYYELPTVFVATVDINPTSKTRWPQMFVNKETLQGAWCKLRNDFLGGAETAFAFIGYGYYAHSIEPALLFDEIESARESATGKVRERIDYILANVKEDDNNVVIIGKLKQ
ncbi:MAG: 6-bladed beta-propeller [Mucinivorans sp.]